jgi:hypothetical protein
MAGSLRATDTIQPEMAKKWRLTTWTKGTGAFIEPLDQDGKPQATARPGGLAPTQRRGAWNPRRTRADAPTEEHRTAPDARRRHALRHMDGDTVDRLEELERRLSDSNAA